MKNIIKPICIIVLLFYLSAPVFADNGQTLLMSLNDTFVVQNTPEWNVKVEKLLTLRMADVKVTPKSGYDFNMMLYFKCDTPDLGQFDTPQKMADNVKASSAHYLPHTVEKTATLHSIPISNSFGYFTILTDAKVASMPTPPPGEYKYLTRGMVRLSKDSALGFSVMTNDLSSPGYQNLFQYVFSLTFSPKTEAEGIRVC